jgi:hypothetical protein
MFERVPAFLLMIGLVSLLIDEVEKLVVSASLTPDQGADLKAKLDAITEQLEEEKIKSAIVQLQAFVDQIKPSLGRRGFLL